MQFERMTLQQFNTLGTRSIQNVVLDYKKMKNDINV